MLFEEKSDFEMRQRLTPKEAERFQTLAALLCAQFENSASARASAAELELAHESQESVAFIIEAMEQEGPERVAIITNSMKALQLTAQSLEGFKEGNLPMGLKLSRECCELAFQLRNVAIAVFDPSQDPVHLDFGNAQDVTKRVQSAADPKATMEKVMSDTIEAFSKPFTPLVIRAANFTV